MVNIKQRYEYSFILLKQLIKTDFKLRYQGSALGYVWSLLKPLAIFTVLYFVFANFLKIGAGIPNYAIYLLVGIVVWNYFTELTSGAIGSVVGKGDLIRKINFPKYVIVLASSASAIISLGFNAIIVIGFMIIFGADTSWGAVIAIPLVLLQVTLLGLGLGLFMSAFFVKYKDIAYIWEVISQAMFYATPILYPIALIPIVAQKVLILNPVAQGIQDIRHFLVTPETTQIQDIITMSPARIIPVTATLTIFILGILYFRKKSKYFAEEV